MMLRNLLRSDRGLIAAGLLLVGLLLNVPRHAWGQG